MKRKPSQSSKPLLWIQSGAQFIFVHTLTSASRTWESSQAKSTTTPWWCGSTAVGLSLAAAEPSCSVQATLLPETSSWFQSITAFLLLVMSYVEPVALILSVFWNCQGFFVQDFCQLRTNTAPATMASWTKWRRSSGCRRTLRVLAVIRTKLPSSVSVLAVLAFTTLSWLHLREVWPQITDIN